MARIWVAELYISYSVGQKLIHRHRLDPEEVRRAVVGVSGLEFSWHVHPDRGERAIVNADVGGRPCLVVLYEGGSADPDAWNLGSAYPTDGA